MSRFNADDTVTFFRPLHESNGAWFWWGQQDPAEFAALWQGMFRYLTDTKGLHNLLWVYSANRNFDGTREMDPARYYPGHDYVDVLALDIYDDDLTDAAPFRPGYTPRDVTSVSRSRSRSTARTTPGMATRPMTARPTCQTTRCSK